MMEENSKNNLVENMGPKENSENQSEKKDTVSNLVSVEATNAEDFAEIENVNENLDLLHSALDSMEQRADLIKAQLLELLSSNREIVNDLRASNLQKEFQNLNSNDDKNTES